MQNRYIDQIFDLFQDFHILLIPQLTEEVRGVNSIRSFSEHLIKEYNPEEQRINHKLIVFHHNRTDETIYPQMET